MKEQNIKSALWLLDYKNFDYYYFDINWVKLCTPNLLKEISSEYFVKQKIAKRFVAAYNAGRVDQELLDICFRYFADVLDIKNSGNEPM
ncbi:MAG: hypothetical protein NC341_11860 [Blautia sp.]|nr:hypothetical protein [Blautia sp.]